ncbi:MAG: hypothetical protein R3E48_07790 [Burkholderiaceae bacterium]
MSTAAHPSKRAFSSDPVGKELLAQARAAGVIARFTVLEAWRSRWLLASLVAIAVVAGASLFARELALVERAALTLAVAAPLLRLTAVFLVAVFATVLVVRELGDRTIELLIGAPVARSTWVLGKWAGLAAIAVLTATLAAVPLIWFASPAALAGWWATLAAELVLVCGFALLISISFAQVAVSILAMTAFYLVSRMIGVVLLLQKNLPLEVPGALDAIGGGLIRALDLSLPRLDLFARTAWLLEGGAPATSALWACATQFLLYGVLLAVVGCLDFGRRHV